MQVLWRSLAQLGNIQLCGRQRESFRAVEVTGEEGLQSQRRGSTRWPKEQVSIVSPKKILDGATETPGLPEIEYISVSETGFWSFLVKGEAVWIMNNGKVLCRMPAHNGQRVTTVKVDVDNMQLPPLTSIYKCNAFLNNHHSLPDDCIPIAKVRTWHWWSGGLIPTSRRVSLDN